MKQYFINNVQSFKGGRLANFRDVWKTISSDSEVLNCVEGQYIEFPSQPTQNLGIRRKTFNTSDSLTLKFKNCSQKVSLHPLNMNSGNIFPPFLWQIKKMAHIE